MTEERSPTDHTSYSHHSTPSLRPACSPERKDSIQPKAPLAVATMDALLRQSRSMCPFLNKTSPATLRSLSTSIRHVSSGGGTMSNLQFLARRCPVMGKAMAVQSAKTGHCALNGVFGGVRDYGGKAKMHTSRLHHANVAPELLRREEIGSF